MAAPPAVQRSYALALKVAAGLAFLPPLLSRLVIGQAFYQTGGGKLEHIENTVNFFRELQIPLPELNAAFVSRLEYYGGMLLIVGLLTRLVSGLLASTMVVALLTADKANFTAALMGQGEAGLTDVTAFVYLLFLIWLAVSGPGLLSLDALIARWIGTPPPAAPPPAG